MFNQPLATSRKEFLKVRPPIVRIGPLQRLPAPLPIRECHLGVNPVAQVNPVRVILRRRQHQLGGRNVPWVKIERPGLRVLFTSGYSGTALRNGDRIKEGEHFLSKPYRRDELARKLDEVFERPSR